jgi:drug/metabolite transporter (DMT)-like permease
LSPALSSRLTLLASAVLFSTGGAAVKMCSLGPWEVTGLRAAIAAATVLLIVPAARRGWTGRTLLVAAAYAASAFLFVGANKATTALNTIFLQSTTPLYILLLGPVLLGERVRRHDGIFIGVLIAGLSLFFVGVEPPRVTAPRPFLGNVLALSCGVTVALMMMGLRWLNRGGQDAGPGAVVLGNLVAVAVAAPLVLPLGKVAASDWAVLGYLGVVQIGCGYALLLRALEHVGALEASLLMFIEPVLSPCWAWLLHGEQPGAWSLLGGAVILAGTAWHATRSVKREPLAAELAAS